MTEEKEEEKEEKRRRCSLIFGTHIWVYLFRTKRKGDQERESKNEKNVGKEE